MYNIKIIKNISERIFLIDQKSKEGLENKINKYINSFSGDFCVSEKRYFNSFYMCNVIHVTIFNLE